MVVPGTAHIISQITLFPIWNILKEKEHATPTNFKFKLGLVVVQGKHTELKVAHITKEL